MNKKTAFLIVLLSLFVVGMAVYNFYQTHEYKEITIHEGLRGEARKNPLYAARLFLKRMGIPAISKDSLQGVGDLPDSDTVIVLTSSRSSLSSRRIDKLMDWVKSGGHLVARSTTDWTYFGEDEDKQKSQTEKKSQKTQKTQKNKRQKEMNAILAKRESRDPLQRLLGIKTGKRVSFNSYFDNTSDVNENNEESKEKEDEDEEDKANIENDPDFMDMLSGREIRRKKHTIKLKGSDRELQIQSDWFRPLLLDKSRFSQSEQIKIKGHNFIIRQHIGKGMVTLVSDLEFIKNYPLEKSDHAEILWHLVHGLHPALSQPAAVWLINNDEMPSLWSLIWRHGWTLLVSLSLLLLFWLWRNAQRFGPLIPRQTEDRRSLNEHIRSSGNYYWKHNQKKRLINSARQSLMKKMAHTHPGWAQLSQEQQIQLLAELSGMKTEAIQRLLFSNEDLQADEFTQLIRQLEKIRKMQ